VIERDEIAAKADEFGLHTSNVQRDYVYGWLIYGLFAESRLGEVLALKGGNALRKGYFPTTRFSDDLDFTTQVGWHRSTCLWPGSRDWANSRRPRRATRVLISGYQAMSRQLRAVGGQA
jgi:hypothetical protein